MTAVLTIATGGWGGSLMAIACNGWWWDGLRWYYGGQTGTAAQYGSIPIIMFMQP